MNEMLKSVLPTIVDLAAKISNSQICAYTSNGRIFPADTNAQQDCAPVEYIEVYWAKTSQSLKATLEFRLKLYVDHIMYEVADFKYDIIEWTDPQCLDKITKILTDMQDKTPS